MALPNASLTLRACARLLSYPDATLRSHLELLRQTLHDEHALGDVRLRSLDALIDDIAGMDELEAQAAYVELFDRGRATSLYLFEHVHGDSRDRGPAMIDLAQTYEKAGLYLAPDELPDYLPVVLEFASTQPPKEARAFLSETAHILNSVLGALQQRDSAYAAVLAALVELAGEKVQPANPAPEESMDASWAEPAAFDGCSAAGQAGPGQPQPIRIVRRASDRSTAATTQHQGASS